MRYYGCVFLGKAYLCSCRSENDNEFLVAFCHISRFTKYKKDKVKKAESCSLRSIQVIAAILKDASI